ncbi:unnamed protein product, partial [marine sediment metagenome]
MVAGKSIEKGLVFGIIALFIVSAVSPMVIGLTVKTVDKKIIDEDYAFYRFDEHSYPERYSAEKRGEPADNAASTVSLDSKETSVTPLIEKKNYEPQRGPMDSPWPMKCHDLHHTGRSQYSTADNPGYEKWRFRSYYGEDGKVESSAVIGDDGTIYFGTMGSDHRLYALYPNGTEKWSYRVGATIWS